jgi:hypothetical protein
MILETDGRALRQASDQAQGMISILSHVAQFDKVWLRES